MSRKLTEESSQESMFAWEVSPAKTYQWPENAKAWLDSGQGYGSSFYALLNQINRESLSLKMCPAFFPAMEDEILPLSSEGWSSAGMASLGGCLTLSISEWPSDASVCSLSEVLETEVLPKYFLSPKACRGILRRAEKRGRELPKSLYDALKQVAMDGESEQMDQPEPLTELAMTL